MSEYNDALNTVQGPDEDLLLAALEARAPYIMADGTEAATENADELQLIHLQINGAFYYRDDADTTAPHDNSNDPLTIVTNDNVRFKKSSIAVTVPDSFKIPHIDIKGFFTTPPGGSQNGDIIVVKSPATDDFENQENKFGILRNSVWQFYDALPLDQVHAGGKVYQYRRPDGKWEDTNEVHTWQEGLGSDIFVDGGLKLDKLEKVLIEGDEGYAEENSEVGHILGHLESGFVGRIDPTAFGSKIAVINGDGFTTGNNTLDEVIQFTTALSVDTIGVSIEATGHLTLPEGIYAPSLISYADGTKVSSTNFQIEARNETDNITLATGTVLKFATKTVEHGSENPTSTSFSGPIIFQSVFELDDEKAVSFKIVGTFVDSSGYQGSIDFAPTVLQLIKVA